MLFGWAPQQSLRVLGCRLRRALWTGGGCCAHWRTSSTLTWHANMTLLGLLSTTSIATATGTTWLRPSLTSFPRELRWSRRTTESSPDYRSRFTGRRTMTAPSSRHLSSMAASVVQIRLRTPGLVRAEPRIADRPLRCRAVDLAMRNRPDGLSLVPTDFIWSHHIATKRVPVIRRSRSLPGCAACRHRCRAPLRCGRPAIAAAPRAGSATAARSARACGSRACRAR
jgi:hypothetical protein